ncbi:DUF5313 family protein [Gordonia pseudamarae]|uniref:DUF5313 family protein n=1 Tax=Gordonia pseudamarae TaxID=2831662 RepID=UPI001BCAC18A|nr:DUF5313 family protein [Gordonia pseudamarae]
MSSPELSTTGATEPIADGRHDPIHRPNPLRWISYAYGAALPAKNRSWAYNDLTGAFAVPRHLLRSQFSFLPIYLAFYFGFPGQVGIRLAMVALAASLAFIFSLSYMAQNRARRLQKNGLDGTTLTQRRQREAEAERAAYEAIHGDRGATTS